MKNLEIVIRGTIDINEGKRIAKQVHVDTNSSSSVDDVVALLKAVIEKVKKDHKDKMAKLKERQEAIDAEKSGDVPVGKPNLDDGDPGDGDPGDGDPGDGDPGDGDPGDGGDPDGGEVE